MKISSNKPMGLSSIALEQREKELKALKNFLAYSLIGSLALHVGVLASGVGNLFTRVAEVEEDPVELTFVETPKPEEQKNLPEPEVDDNSQILTSSNSGGGGGGISAQQRTQEKPVIPKQISQNPVSKLTKLQPLQRSESFTAKLPQKTVSTNRQERPTRVTSNQNTAISKDDITEDTTTPASTASKANLGNVISGIRNFGQTVANGNNSSTGGNGGTITGSGTGTITGSGTGTITGSGTGTITGSGNGNNQQNNNSIVAAAPTTPRTESDLGNNRRNSSRSGDGRAACRECNTKYPDWARKRKVEGRVEVAVDTDNSGNITNVRLLRSSGNDRLDAEHLERARNWKLKPSSSGRNGVTIATEYAIEGSDRYRQLQERRRQRTAQANNSSDSTAETPRRRRRLVASSGDNIASETSRETRRIRRRREIAAVSSDSTPSRREQPTVTRRRRREFANADSNTASASPRVNRRRKRRDFNQPAAVNTNNSASSSSSSGRRRRRELPTAAPASESSSTQ